MRRTGSAVDQGFESRPAATKPPSARPLTCGCTSFITAPIVAALGGFLFGFDTACINGAVSALQTHFKTNALLMGLSVSLALLGSAGGALAAGQLADRLGRIRTMLIAAVLFASMAVARPATPAPRMISFLPAAEPCRLGGALLAENAGAALELQQVFGDRPALVLLADEHVDRLDGFGADRHCAHGLHPAHAHLNLLGWASLALMGTFYSLSGQTGRLGWINFYISVAAVVVLIPSLSAYLTGNKAANPGVMLGSMLAIVGMLTFAGSVFSGWKTARA